MNQLVTDQSDPNYGIWSCSCGWIFETDTHEIKAAAKEHRRRHKCRAPLLVPGYDHDHANGRAPREESPDA